MELHHRPFVAMRRHQALHPATHLAIASGTIHGQQSRASTQLHKLVKCSDLVQRGLIDFRGLPSAGSAQRWLTLSRDHKSCSPGSLLHYSLRQTYAYSKISVQPLSQRSLSRKSSPKSNPGHLFPTSPPLRRWRPSSSCRKAQASGASSSKRLKGKTDKCTEGKRDGKGISTVSSSPSLSSFWAA